MDEINTVGKEVKVQAVSGFKIKLSDAIHKPDVSLGCILGLLAYQPTVVAHLLVVANSICLIHNTVGSYAHAKQKIFEKPTTLEGVVNVLGIERFIKELSFVEETPVQDDSHLRHQSVKSYILASILASLAECKLGRKDAADYFLVGLLADFLEKNEKATAECHFDIRRRFHDTQPNGAPTIIEATHLVEAFSKGEYIESRSYLYTTWVEATDRAHRVLETDVFGTL